MTEPDSDMESTRPISVAELLAKNGTLGAPAVTRRRRRRRGDTDSVSVAELTGEIPIIGDDHPDDPSSRKSSHQSGHESGPNDEPRPEPERTSQRASERVHERPPKASPEKVSEKTPVQALAEPGQGDTKDKYWSEPEPRWPRSPVQARRGQGPERSAYPRPLPQSSGRDTPAPNGAKSESGAEGMSPDPVDDYADVPVDVMDSEVRDAEPVSEDSAYVRSFLQASEGTLFGGQTLADEMARQFSDRRKVAREADEVDEDGHAGVGLSDQETEHETEHETDGAPARFDSLWRGGLIVLQSILAVAFGAGLFVAFDQLWQWNSIVALALSVLVILGLVVGVRVVRKTEDIASTLIAVAVGALITLGPLALSLQAS